jgi:hypothetical protein
MTRVDEIVHTIRRVPDEVRRFAVTAPEARSRHRIESELLDELLQAGLPFAGSGPDRLFDDYDLGNAALHLGLMSVQRMALRSWANALRRHNGREFVHARVGFAPRCPSPGHSGDCEFAMLQPGGDRTVCVGNGDGTSVIDTLDVKLPGDWPQPTPAVQALLGEISDVAFFLLPEVIRWDIGFLKANRIADCGGVARHLVDEGARRGLPTRFGFGLLVAVPYSTPHCWAEFEVDGRWTPFDPLLLGMLSRLGLTKLPQDHSIGTVVSRLTGRFTKLASHSGIFASLSLPTQEVL